MLMKKIFDRYDKNLITDLPRAIFEGKIVVIVSESEAKKVVQHLMKQPLLGFDTETRPTFLKGKTNKVSLLQVCTDNNTCYLFRLCRISLPSCLVKLLSDTRITKLGLSWHDDLHALMGRKTFHAGTFIDLQDLAAQMGIQDQSLQKLYANILGRKIAKGQRLSNWDADCLSEAQMRYAATDAWACIQLYKEMKRMQEEGYSLIKSEEMKE